MFHLEFGFSTLIAPVGHRFSQIPQKIQLSISIPTLPLVRSKLSFFLIGYIAV
jgi:hypothetical protein